MRCAKTVMFVLLVATLAWSEASAAGLEAMSTDGWHSWSVEVADGQQAQFYIRFEDGRLTRIHSTNCSCQQPTREAIEDHGAITASESFAWFRAVVEDTTVDKRIRDAALFGLVQSGGEDAFEYIDRILSRR